MTPIEPIEDQIGHYWEIASGVPPSTEREEIGPTYFFKCVCLMSNLYCWPQHFNCKGRVIFC
jgi:hypothetical protein